MNYFPPHLIEQCILSEEEFDLVKKYGKCYISTDEGYDGGSYEVKWHYYNGKMIIESIKLRGLSENL